MKVGVLITAMAATVLLIGCNQSTVPITDTVVNPAVAMSTPAVFPTSVSTLSPPGCFGLFVDMKDRFADTMMYSVNSRWRNGVHLRQRVYEFSLGEPITVTVAVLMFGEGDLVLIKGNILREYRITIVDSHGQEMPMTSEGEHYLWNDRSSERGGYVVDQNTLSMESFQINKWFDLSSTGSYTLTLTREVFISGKSYEATGNPVGFEIEP